MGSSALRRVVMFRVRRGEVRHDQSDRGNAGFRWDTTGREAARREAVVFATDLARPRHHHFCRVSCAPRRPFARAKRLQPHLNSFD